MKKAELENVVTHYEMQPLIDNEIRQKQVGYYLQAAEPIQELDSLVLDDNGSSLPTSWTGLYQPDGSVIYRVVCPCDWIID